VRAAQIVLVGATVVFLALALARSWDQVAAYEWTLKPGWLVASLVVFALYYWTQAAGWWLLLTGMGLVSRFLATCAIWGSSILARYIPGTVFMFVGRAWLHHAQGLDLPRVAAAMVYEQALQVCSALVAIALLWPLARAGPAWASWSLLAVPVLLVLLHPRAFLPLADRTLRLLHREPLAASLPFGLVLAMLWYYVATWLLVGAGAWLLARATVDAEGDALALVAAAYALAYVAGMVAFIVPSGVGVREAVLAGALRTEFGGGVALAWALLLRLWQTAAEVLFVGMVVAADRASRPSVTRRRASVDGREDATMKERE
jgi:glycosyltransferase 2 family protein